jgi:glycosyltransferase involved in cell wall biosynthesis
MKILFLTSIPSFYKITLINELNKQADAKIFFTNRTDIKRHSNFFSELGPDRILTFSPSILGWKKIWGLLINAHKSDKVIVGGWDDFWYWFIAFSNPVKRNVICLESSIFDNWPENSFQSKIKKYIKTIFIGRMGYAIPSGQSQMALLKLLNFKGHSNLSGSVGLLDFPYAPVQPRKDKIRIRKALFIGRICYEKGVDLLAKAVNELEDLELGLIGEMEDASIGNLFIHPRIKLLGYKQRHELKSVFAEFDFLVLPSRIEPWGLVVEEALYHGLPVVISSAVGCKYEWVIEPETGIEFDSGNFQSLNNAIIQMASPIFYQNYCRNIEIINFEQRKSNYLKAFLSYGQG